MSEQSNRLSKWLDANEIEELEKYEIRENANYEDLSNNSKEDLICAIRILLWRQVKLTKKLDEADIDLHNARREAMQRFQVGKIHGKGHALRAQKTNIKIGRIVRSNLGAGRNAGTKKRSLQAKELNESLFKAIHDLFMHGEGWKMGNKK